MKTLVFSLILTLASVASFAQTQGISVYNSTNSYIFVTVSIVNINTCLPAGTQTVPVPPRQTIIIPPISPGSNFIWSGLSAIAFPTGESVTSSSPCAPCLTTPDSSGGLGADWDLGVNCNYVEIFD